MKVLIWIHGGCFSGGSIHYDKNLREFLFQNGWTVIPVDFDLTDYYKAIQYIEETVYKLFRIKGNEIILGGISSGGFLAHQVANIIKIPAILLCPVIKPFDRHFDIPQDLQEKQLSFFHTLENMKEIQDSVSEPNNKRFIIFGAKDNRAPFQVYSDWLSLDNVRSTIIDAGHELCNNPPLKLFLDSLENYLNSNIQ